MPIDADAQVAADRRGVLVAANISAERSDLGDLR